MYCLMPEKNANTISLVLCEVEVLFLEEVLMRKILEIFFLNFSVDKQPDQEEKKQTVSPEKI